MSGLRLILRLVGLRALWYFLGIMALVEAIYTAEEFTTLMEFIVANGGSVTDTLILAALRTPEVVDFALPIAILISLYYAITNARENNELLVCAAAGVSWTRIPRFAVLVGIIGFAISLIFAGLITPAANYAFRITSSLLEGKYVIQEVTATGVRNTIRTFEDHTFIATPSDDPKASRGNLFILQEDTGDGWRVSQAEDWSVVGPRDDGSHALRLLRYRDYIGRTPAQQAAYDAETEAVQSTLESAKWNVQNISFVVRLEELVKPVDRHARPHEVLLAPWFQGARADFITNWHAFDRRIGEATGRALGCVFAALLAVAAAAWSGSRIGRYGAVPVAVALILGGDTVFRTILAEAAQTDIRSFFWSFAIVLAGALLVPLAYIGWRREAIITPRRGHD